MKRDGHKAATRSPATAKTLEAARADCGTRKDGWGSESDAQTGTFNARSEHATGQADDSGAVCRIPLIGRDMVRQSRTAHTLPSQHEGRRSSQRRLPTRSRSEEFGLLEAQVERSLLKAACGMAVARLRIVLFFSVSKLTRCRKD